MLLLNLRLLGLGIERQPVAQVWRDTRPWMMSSLAIMLVSGMSASLRRKRSKLYYHEAFWVKMTSLALAMLFTFTVVRTVALADPKAAFSPWWSKTVALISPSCCGPALGVGGRWIGFS